MRKRTSVLQLPPLSLLNLLCAAFVRADNLPYNPTRLFLSSVSGTDKKIVYQLDPPSTSATNGLLRSIPLGADLNPSSLSYNTITSSLPFLQADPSIAILSSQDPDGGISTYAGGCAVGSQSAQLWRFIPSNSSATGQGTWSQQTLSSNGNQAQTAPTYLASTITFSPTTLEKDASVYAFGGMCPNQASTDDDTWTKDATYSNQLIKIQADTPNGGYVSQVMTGLSQPIAEAGFSITPLSPAYSNSSIGALTQQQNFLLLGGHTQTAFINMSQVALFSLPEASWIFLPIYDTQAKTDLRPRDTSTPAVEPRSGHTAILSSDGSKVIVLGGWVGDISNPADPQVAVLEVGAGYGGSSSSSWTWTDANPQTSPFSDGSGIYGHGAVLLPGNVMMVTGGYQIPAPSASVKRDAQSTTFFYNITSGDFVSSYSPTLASVSPTPSEKASQGPLSTTSQKAGLGVGLTLGLLAVGLAFLFGWMYWRKLKHRQEYQVQFTSRGHYNHAVDGRVYMAQQSGFSSDEQMDEKHAALQRGVWNEHEAAAHEIRTITQPRAQNGWSGIREAERTGLDVNVPSPNRGLRKGRGPLTSHTLIQVDARMNRSSGAISPIDELPENERGSSDSNRALRAKALGDDKDPFRDPSPEPQHSQTDGSSETNSSRGGLKLDFPLPPGVGAQQGRQHEMQMWMRDWKASDLASRRGSPDKSDRTLSSLSEQSQHQANTWRNGYLQYLPVALNPFADSRDSQSPSPDHSDGHGRSQEPFYTAQTSLHDLQSTENPHPGYVSGGGTESETLLGSHTSSTPARHGQHGHKYSTSQAISSPISPDTEPTFTYPAAPLNASHQGYGTSRPARRSTGSSRLGSWVGSVRRTLANPTASYQRSASMNSVSAANYMSNNYHNPTGGLVDADEYTDDGSASNHGGRSASNSPTKMSNPRHRIKRKPVSLSTSSRKTEPRRVMSDSAHSDAAFWAARKQAHGTDTRHADDSEGDEQDDHRDHGLDQSPSDGEEHSSVVKEIVKKRVLFKMPHEPLRVVNKDADDDDVRSDAESDVSAMTAVADSPKDTGKVGLQIRKIEEARLASVQSSGVAR